MILGGLLSRIWLGLHFAAVLVGDLVGALMDRPELSFDLYLRYLREEVRVANRSLRRRWSPSREQAALKVVEESRDYAIRAFPLSSMSASQFEEFLREFVLTR